MTAIIWRRFRKIFTQIIDQTFFFINKNYERYSNRYVRQTKDQVLARNLSRNDDFIWNISNTQTIFYQNRNINKYEDLIRETEKHIYRRSKCLNRNRARTNINDFRFLTKESQRLQIISEKDFIYRQKSKHRPKSQHETYFSYEKDQSYDRNPLYEKGPTWGKFSYHSDWHHTELVKRQVRIKISNIMKFNLEETSMAFFIQRTQHIAKIENKKSILIFFSICLKEFVLKWHISLSAIMRAEMNNDFKIWENEFLKKFRLNKFEFLKKAKKFFFCFDESFTLNQYFFRKSICFTTHTYLAKISWSAIFETN